MAIDLAESLLADFKNPQTGLLEPTTMNEWLLVGILGVIQERLAVLLRLVREGDEEKVRELLAGLEEPMQKLVRAGKK